MTGNFRGLLDRSENFRLLRFILLQHLHELVVLLRTGLIAIEERADLSDDIRMSAETAPSWLTKILHFDSVSAGDRTKRNSGSSVTFVPVTTTRPSAAVV
jgi:hypothetical protein